MFTSAPRKTIGGESTVRAENPYEDRGLEGKRPRFLGGIFDSPKEVLPEAWQKEIHPTTEDDRRARLSQLEDARRVAKGIMYLQVKQNR